MQEVSNVKISWLYFDLWILIHFLVLYMNSYCCLMMSLWIIIFVLLVPIEGTLADRYFCLSFSAQIVLFSFCYTITILILNSVTNLTIWFLLIKLILNFQKKMKLHKSVTISWFLQWCFWVIFSFVINAVDALPDAPLHRFIWCRLYWMCLFLFYYLSN